MGKVNLGELIARASVSNLDTGREQIEYICCLECSRAKKAYYACDRMCAKAQALRKDKRDENKSREEARRAQQQLEYQADMQKS